MTTAAHVKYSNCIRYNFFIFCPICMKFSHNFLHTYSFILSIIKHNWKIRRFWVVDPLKWINKSSKIIFNAIAVNNYIFYSTLTPLAEKKHQVSSHAVTLTFFLKAFATSWSCWYWENQSFLGLSRLYGTSELTGGFSLFKMASIELDVTK